jgi:PTS system ascorbate-specific IIA component
VIRPLGGPIPGEFDGLLPCAPAHQKHGRDFRAFFCSKADMAGILIIAHAPFASALRECVSHIYGGLPARIGVIDVSADCDPAQVVAFAHAEIDRLKEENGALVLTDMYGATPANIAGRLASIPDVRVLAGVNLPMLVRAVCYRATPLDVLVDKALAGASKGIQAVGPATPAAASADADGCFPASPSTDKAPLETCKAGAETVCNRSGA